MFILTGYYLVIFLASILFKERLSYKQGTQYHENNAKIMSIVSDSKVPI